MISPRNSSIASINNLIPINQVPYQRSRRSDQSRLFTAILWTIKLSRRIVCRYVALLFFYLLVSKLCLSDVTLRKDLNTQTIFVGEGKRLTLGFNEGIWGCFILTRSAEFSWFLSEFLLLRSLVVDSKVHTFVRLTAHWPWGSDTSTSCP